MKKFIRIVLVVLAALSMWNCTDQQPVKAPQREVKFTIHTAASGPNGRTQTADLPEGTALLLSIRKSTGETVMTNQRIELLKMGDGYVSGTISLYPGSYAVVDFMLAHGSDVLYATPQATSPLANQVTQPLPYEFTVSADEQLTLDAEVISTTGTAPEQFGYVSFNITIKDGESIPIQVYVQSSLSDGEAFIMDGYDTLVHTALIAATNDVPFRGDPTAVYNLVVLRHGYMRYQRQFTYNDLKTQLQGNPLQVTLVPGVTYVTVDYSYTRFGVTASLQVGHGPTGKVFVDFGEPGESPGQWSFGPFIDSEPDHNYGRRQGGDYFVSFNGDLDKLVEFGAGFNIDTMDVSHMPRLKVLTLPQERRLRALDLTHNDSLEVLNLGFAQSFRSADLSRICTIREVHIAGTAFTSVSVSDLIDDVHAAVIHNNTHGGSFDYTNVATPSPGALDQLRALRDQYGWSITPNP